MCTRLAQHPVLGKALIAVHSGDGDNDDAAKWGQGKVQVNPELRLDSPVDRTGQQAS